MGPRLQRMSDGSLRFTELAPWFVGVLVQLPDLLDSDQPDEVSRRLYPEPSDDEEIREAWKKFVRPELFALVASAREIVLQDIGNLRLGADPDPRGEDSELLPPGLEIPGLAMCSLDIPGDHVQAWISALNVARLTLSTRFGLEDTDMTEPDDEGEDDDELDDDDFDPANVFDMRRVAVAQVHLLGFLQQMLIEEENPPPSDAKAPWSPPR